MVEDDLYLLCVYTFEPVKELLCGRPRPEVFEERRYGNASSTKYPGAANLVGLALDRIAIVPVRHGSPRIRPGSVGIRGPDGLRKSLQSSISAHTYAGGWRG